MNDKLQKLEAYFSSLEEMTPDQLTGIVEKELNDEELELFVRHIEDFYGIEDEEEIGLLTQLMVSGYFAAKATMGQTINPLSN
jgi:hypothetical protein